MCGRFVSVSSPQLLVDRFGVEETAIDEREPDYNVTPRAMVPIVRERKPRQGDDGPTKRVLTMVRWGLVPSWAESTAIGDKLINARAETITEKAAYKRTFRRRRCIDPRVSRTSCIVVTANRSRSPGCGRSGATRPFPIPTRPTHGCVRV
jgi:putative SOS response-associated peptidase YedK